MDKLNSLSNLKEKKIEVTERLGMLGLNDTNDSLNNSSVGNNKKKNTVVDDSIEWLDDSNSGDKNLNLSLSKSAVNKLKSGEFKIDETPEAVINCEDSFDEKDELIKPLKIPSIDRLREENVVANTPDSEVAFENSYENESSYIKPNNNEPVTSYRNNVRVEDSDIEEVESESPKKEDSPHSDNHKSHNQYEILNKQDEKKPNINNIDQRQIASWSPNYERIKAKIEKNIQSPKRIQMIDIVNVKNEKPSTLSTASGYGNFDIGGITGATTQIRNRNYAYEDELKRLSEKILKTLTTKPKPDDIDHIKPPKALKVSLLNHQYYSLSWLKWREANMPRGGILADDMGLGKTLTILTYLRMIKEQREEQMKKALEEEEEEEEENDENDEPFKKSSKYKLPLDDDDDDEDDVEDRKKSRKNSSKSSSKKLKRLKTLIIVPASLLHQWENEIRNRFEKNAFKYHMYHEANRKKFAYNLGDNDIVFTTYEIVSRELDAFEKDGGDSDGEAKSVKTAGENSPLAKIKWKRVILDEAHRIKNHTTKANKVICSIRSKYRIAITGTPIQNSLNDFYSLVKFLRLEPLDDLKLWKYVFASETQKSSTNKNAPERELRLNSWLLVLSDLLILRRTKMDTINVAGVQKKLVDLPDKEIKIIYIKLSANERFIYEKIFKESKDKVNKFLNNQQKRVLGAKSVTGNNFSEVLVYLLRLRQACSHLSLLAECLDINELQAMKLETEGLENMMENMSINSSSSSINDLNVKNELSDELSECLDRRFVGAKLNNMLTILDEKLEEYPEDKLIVVSQWTSMLDIVAAHMRKRDLEYCEIRGDVNLAKRNEIVERFNKSYDLDNRVMLLSLNAGGVGLNLIGANRMFLLDIHWNPALEQQASDRIYRVGQKKNVEIYRFICKETIEERIESLQQYKIELAQRVCSAGSMTTAPASSAKLTLRDIKLLFADFETPNVLTSISNNNFNSTNNLNSNRI